jgi:hypothetical protein
MEPDTWAKRFREWGALLITGTIYALFAYSLWKSGSPETPTAEFTKLSGTIENLALLAAGYWLGSSAQGQRNQEHAAVQQSETMKQLANSVPAQLVLPAPLKPVEVPIAPIVPDVPAKPVVPERPAQPADMREL